MLLRPHPEKRAISAFTRVFDTLWRMSRRMVRPMVRDGAIARRRRAWTRFRRLLTMRPIAGSISVCRKSEGGFQPQVIEPVHRLDVDALHAVVLQQIERHRSAG